jgi:hypothetical protein
MNELDVYLWTRLDSIRFVVCLIAWTYWLASFVATIWICVLRSGNEYKEPKVIKFSLAKMWIGFVLIAFISCIFPTSREYAMIKVIPRIANSELSAQIQKDVPELYQIAMAALKEKIAPKETKSKSEG